MEFDEFEKLLEGAKRRNTVDYDRLHKYIDTSKNCRMSEYPTGPLERSQFRHSADVDVVESLVPCVTTSRRFRFPQRQQDTLRGIYIPEHVEWVRLHSISFQGTDLQLQLKTSKNKTLDELREETQRLPSVKDLDSLLERARCSSEERAGGYVHTGRETIVLGGVVYRRYVLIEPCIPLNYISSEVINLVFSHDVTFYAEHETFSCNFKQKICKVMCDGLNKGTEQGRIHGVDNFNFTLFSKYLKCYCDGCTRNLKCDSPPSKGFIGLSGYMRPISVVSKPVTKLGGLRDTTENLLPEMAKFGPHHKMALLNSIEKRGVTSLTKPTFGLL